MTSSNYPQNQTMNNTAMDSLSAMFNVTEVDSFSSIRDTTGVSDNSRRESSTKILDGWFDYGKDGDEYEEYEYGYGNYTDGHEENLSARDLAVAILLGLIVLAGIFGNILALVVIAAVKSMHTTVNKCLFSLGLADLLVIVIFYPYLLAVTGDVSLLVRRYCILHSYPRGALICSILSVLYITVDRYIALCYPFHPKKYSSGKKIYVILAAIWAVAVLFALPYLHVLLARSRNCVLTYGGVLFERYDLAVLIIFQLLPFPVLIILSGRMIYVLSSKVPSEKDHGETGETAGRRGRNQVVILAVVVTFVLCHIPISISDFLWHFIVANASSSEPISKLVQATYMFTIFNSAINPVFYFSMSSKFRCALKELLTNCRKKRSAETSGRNTSIVTTSTYL